MRTRLALGAFAVLTLSVSGVLAGGNLKSGVPVGKSVGAFSPLNITGKFAGRKQCLVWANASNPVAMIFARDLNDNLASLVKKIDAATVKNKSCKMGSFVVFLNDEEGFDAKLEAFAKKHKLTSCALTIDSPAGPKAYKIAKDAHVNVMLYNRKRVAANYAFRKGELDAKNVETIVSDLKKILPE